jgi:hypothetical protein
VSRLDDIQKERNKLLKNIKGDDAQNLNSVPEIQKYIAKVNNLELRTVRRIWEEKGLRWILANNGSMRMKRHYYTARKDVIAKESKKFIRIWRARKKKPTLPYTNDELDWKIAMAERTKRKKERWLATRPDYDKPNL